MSRIFSSSKGQAPQIDGFSELSPGFPTQISVGNSSTQLLPANEKRRYAHIFNNTQNPIYLQFQETAALNQGIKLTAGGYFVLSGGDLWLGSINAIALISNQFIDVVEGV